MCINIGDVTVISARSTSYSARLLLTTSAASTKFGGRPISFLIEATDFIPIRIKKRTKGTPCGISPGMCAGLHPSQQLGISPQVGGVIGTHRVIRDFDLDGFP